MKKHLVKEAEQMLSETIEGHLKYFKGKLLHAGTAAVYYSPQAKKVPGHSLQAQLAIMQGKGGGRDDWRGLLRLDHKRYRHLMDGNQYTKLDRERQLILGKIGGLGFRFTGDRGKPILRFLNAIGHLENMHMHFGRDKLGPSEAAFNERLKSIMQQSKSYHIPRESRPAQDLRALAGEYVSVHQALSNKPDSFRTRGFPKLNTLDLAKFFATRERLTREQSKLQALGFRVKAGTEVTKRDLLATFKAALRVPAMHNRLGPMRKYLVEQGFMRPGRRDTELFASKYSTTPKLRLSIPKKPLQTIGKTPRVRGKRRSTSYMQAIEESYEAPPPSPRARRKKRRKVPRFTGTSSDDEPIVPLRKRKPKFDAETLEPVAEAPTLPEFKGDPFADNNPTGHFNPLRYAKGATGHLMKTAVELYKSGLKPGSES